MRNIVLILLLAGLTSCTGVYFDAPQTLGGEKVNSMPKELQGRWIDKLDTSIITETGLHEIKAVIDSLGKIISVRKKDMILSDSVFMYKSGKYYLVNIVNDHGRGYEVAIIEKQTNGDICWYYPYNSPYFGSRPGLEVKKVVRNKNGKEVINKSLKKVEGESISEIYYSGQLNNDDVKKMLVPKNKFLILKKDGTVDNQTNN